jgi:hypothetical protein
MRPLPLLAAFAGAAALVALAMWAFDLSLERAVILAPALVISVGATAGLVVLWSRAAASSLRRRRQ